MTAAHDRVREFIDATLLLLARMLLMEL